MNKYVLILLWIWFLRFVSNNDRFKREEFFEGEALLRYSPIFAFVSVLPIIIMAATRGRFADSFIYIRLYENMPNSFKDIPSYLNTVNKDVGFSSCSAIVHVLFPNSHTIYLFIFALFQMIIVSSLFRKYSENFIYSLFLFIASADYISYIFNGMRQFTAVVIILLSTPHIIKKKYLKVIIIVLIASVFHRSALIMIPYVFIVQGEPWNKKTLFFIFLAVLAVVFVSRFTSILDSMLSGTQYENILVEAAEWGDDGTNPIRVLLYSIPALWAFFQRREIAKENNLIINICVNMSIVSMGLYLISMVTSGIFLGRLPIYFSLFSYILLPWEIGHLTKPSKRSMVWFSSIVLYLGYYFYIMHFQNSLI